MNFRVLIFLLTPLSLLASEFSTRFDEILHQATPVQLYTFLYDVPKGGDLHNHAGGANIAEWAYAIATDPKRNGGDTFYTRANFAVQPDAINPQMRFRNIRQATYAQLSAAAKTEYMPLASLSAEQRAAWCSSLRLDAPGRGRDEFFGVLWTRMGELNHSPNVRTELLVENIKAFGAEGLKYLETQFDVEGMVDNSGHMIPLEEGVAFVRQRLGQPDVLATGMTVRFIETVLRFAPNAERRLEEQYAFVDAHRDQWVGVNMAGIEENGHGYPTRFLETFRKLRSRYPALALTIHAGEMDGPDSHIRDTLLLGATRIGHGVNLIRDSDTLLLLQQSQHVLVEINLISNKLLEYTPDLTKHPFPEYLRTGVPVCLNTDDRGMWDSNMTDEYYTGVTTFNLSWDELVTLGRNSLKYSFVQPEVKAKLLADYDQRVAAFEAKYRSGDSQAALAKLSTVKPTTYSYAKRTWGFEFK